MSNAVPEQAALRQLIADEIDWLELNADNYGGHPADTLNKRAKELRAALTAALPLVGVKWQPESSAEYHQQRGVAWDIVDEAIEAYRQFMLGDDYEAQPALDSIITRMKERRDFWHGAAALPHTGQPQEGALAEFVRWAISEGPFEGCHLDGSDIQDKAEKLGILIKEKYDPEKHGPSDCAEPGDDWFVFGPLLSAAPASPRAEDGTVKAYYIVNDHGQGTVYYGVSCEIIPDDQPPVADQREVK